MQELYGKLEAGNVRNSQVLFLSFWFVLLGEWNIYMTVEEKWAQFWTQVMNSGLNSGDELGFENVGLHCEESCLEENMRLK